MRKTLSIFSFNMLISIIFFLFSHMIAFSQENKASNQISTEKPIIIHSNSLELEQEKKVSYI